MQRENQRWQAGNLKRPLRAIKQFRIVAFPHSAISAISAFGFLAFLHFVISGISAFCNFWQAFLQFLAFPQLLLFPQFLAFPQLLLFPQFLEILIGSLFIAFTLIFRVLFRLVLSTLIGSKCMWCGVCNVFIVSFYRYWRLNSRNM